MYHYAGNNPVKYIDPDGKTATGAVLGWIGTDIGVPEPTDAIPWKWVGYGATILGASVIDCLVTKAISNSKNKKDTLVILYRAVDSAELESIKKSGGRFSMGDNSTYEKGKLFQTVLADAYAYAETANKTIAKDNPYTAIAVTSVPKGSYEHIDSIIDAPSAVIVPKNNLPLLSPAVIIPLEH